MSKYLIAPFRKIKNISNILGLVLGLDETVFKSK